MEKNIFDINKVKLEEIRMVDASFVNPNNQSVLQEGESINLGISFESGVSLKASRIRAILKCDLNATISTDIKGSFKFFYIFLVEDLSSMVEMDGDNIININSDLLDCLVDTCYSTSRGIIYSRCLGTIFKSVILPISSSREIAKFKID